VRINTLSRRGLMHRQQNAKHTCRNQTTAPVCAQQVALIAQMREV
jgi:hypothetical protein